MELEASGSEYEVFLSFRGLDTRKGFTDVLYECMGRAGIKVFRDDDELAMGDEIEKILLAINNSQICVPILSKTFAQSKWCLKEVTKMVELNKVVVPIFYDVTPDDVDLKTPAYKEFMETHEANGENQVVDWKNSLKAITKFKGREVSNHRYSIFCKTFTEEILRKLKPTKRYNIGPTFGMNDQLDKALKLLDIQSSGVRYIGIHGMGGIGKTTLAMDIFNRLSTGFEYSSFLENVRENSSRPGCLECLQRKLNGSLDAKSAAGSSCSRDINERFNKKKVLIILDDVDNLDQIKELIGDSSWLGYGSRIIITTRTAKVLEEYEILYQESVHHLEMGLLNDDDAIQLFSTYAFGNVSPPTKFYDLSKEAASLACGLPLALKVIGSLLSGDNKEEYWRDVIAKLRKIPPKEVKDKLKLSYDAMQYEEQQIFLDIACFFIGSKKSNPCYMWESCDLYPTLGLSVLEKMSIIKITEENVISMHDQLRDLGRDIVREENVRHPTKRSRLWAGKEAIDVLMSREGKETVEALCVRESLVNPLTDDHLASFQDIRFLELVMANFKGSVKDLLGNLMWLKWQYIPANLSLHNFCLKKLVILDLSGGLIDEDWGGWSHIQEMASSLKVLDLSNCRRLTCTPAFTVNHTLERLILSECSQLATIASTIGNLRSLKLLDLTYCDALRGLPEELGSLKDLQEILFTSTTFSGLPMSIGNLNSLVSLKLQCPLLKEIPMSLGKLTSLVVLDLSLTGVTELPNYIGGLVTLKELSLQRCGDVRELPDSLWYLTSLVQLTLSGTQVSGLSASIGELQELKFLDLGGSKITMLPASIGRLKKLEKLTACLCRELVEVPPEIGELSSLERLDLSWTGIHTLPSTIGELSSLERLNLSWTGIHTLPSTIGELSSLERLDLSSTGIRTLPSTIRQLSLLQELRLEGCHELQELPELPNGLTLILTVPSSGYLKKVHGLSPHKLDLIKDIVLTDTDDLEMIAKLHNLESLEVKLSDATTLPLDLSSWTRLENLRFIRQSEMWIARIKLPRRSTLKRLVLEGLSNLMIEDGLESLAVRDLDNLQEVELSHCSSKLVESCLAKSLTYLRIRECVSLKALPDLSRLRALSYVSVRDCKDLTQISGLAELESLSNLHIRNCDSLERIGDVSELKKLFFLSIFGCPQLTCIEGIDGLHKVRVEISHCERWESREKKGWRIEKWCQFFIMLCSSTCER